MASDRRPASLCAPFDSPSPREGHIEGTAYVYIEREEEASTLRRELEGSARFALDCEAAGFHRYSDRLCLVQLTTDRATYVVDPVAFDAGPLLKAPLENPGTEVVMHGADFDLRLLQRDLGISLGGLFDTQIAAELLGLEALGLAALLEARFDVRLSKKYQRADWAERPLSDGMLQYAAADTHYLLELADQMRGELAEAGRTEWVRQECRALEDAALEPAETEPVDPVTRVKGARDLSPRQVTALRLALEWRDEIALRRDRALFRVVGDGPLVEAVARAPRRHEELVEIKGFPRALARDEGKALVRILGSVVDLPDEELRPYPRHRRDGAGRPPPEVEALADRLKKVRNARADELGLARGTLVSNAVLLEIARAAPPSVEALAQVGGMRPWKIDVIGRSLLDVIERS